MPQLDFGTGSGLLVVVAHPDDETIAAGGHLHKWREARLVTLTDGSPLDLSDAFKAGCRTRVGYAALRRREQCTALSLAGFPLLHCTWRDLVDQQAAYHLVSLSRMIADQIDRGHVDAVLTHPFEGGHPDHDAAAFAVQAAVQLIANRKPTVYEFACYREQEGRLICQNFESFPEYEVKLDSKASSLKRAMIHAHESQHETLSAFQVDTERFRRAPEYDFRHAPPERWYERFRWGMSGAKWERLASEAWAELSELSVLCP